ncbi:MAG TPA: MYXO-CTERM sorting domain-containing protein [Myxococcota bacterium]
MRAAPFVVVVATAITALAAPRATASCAPFDVPQLVPFGGAVLPTNAELRVLARRADVIELVLPDGTLRSLRLIDDEFGQRADFDDAPDLFPLSVGEYGYVFNGMQGTFTVIDIVDTEAPAAPTVTIDNQSTPSVALPWSECGGGTTGIVTRAAFVVDGTTRGDLIVVDGEPEYAFAEDGSTAFTSYGRTDSAEVQLRDAAGNMSEPTFVDASGCGCTSSSPATPLGFMAVLGLLGAVRRRR